MTNKTPSLLVLLSAAPGCAQRGASIGHPAPALEPIWFTRTCVSVQGKAVRIRPDAEAARPAARPQSPS
jgi:hypothetical protein